MDDATPQPAEARLERVLVLNHRGDALEPLLKALRPDRLEVVESRSLRETESLVAAEPRPGVLIVNPLVMQATGVEFELLAPLREGPEPVPLILLVDSPEALAQARLLRWRPLDFLLLPATAEECLHRVELALSHRDALAALAARNRDLEGQVSIDFTTELLSPRYFEQLLQVEFKRAQRHGTPLSLVLVDVDDFKSINDTTEYAFGDLVLKQVAQVLKHNLRETDFAARLGGDEFVLLLPQTTPAEAVQTAVRLRKKVSSHTVHTARYDARVTVSIGIDTYDGRSDSTTEELRRRANKALHEAKRLGKNQVWLYARESDRPKESTVDG